MTKKYTHGREFDYKYLKPLINCLIANKEYNNIEEIFISLFTKNELEEMMRRLLAGWMLVQKKSYVGIVRELKMSMVTISKVSQQLRLHPKGFALIFYYLQKLPKKSKRFFDYIKYISNVSPSEQYIRWRLSKGK